ncbi:hypothetical protein FQR65_LT05673 [Abscondita terminalis]|nr:hypothetical protein FQR65_LT05673 [Abscondita terminalis]
MVKAKLIRKQTKSNLAQKVINKKIRKLTLTGKNKLIKLAALELKKEPVEPPIEFTERKPKVPLKMRLRNRPPPDEEELKPTKNYVLLKRSNVDDDQVTRGVMALYKLLKKNEKKVELFDEDLPIFLQVVCVKVPQCPIRYLRFHLNNSLVTKSSEICLIVADEAKRRDHENTIEHYENLLSEKGITNIKTIIPFNQFKYEHSSQFELKRKLLNLYDYFLVDARVGNPVCKRMGSIFYENRKIPTSVKMNTVNLKQHFDNCLRKSVMKIHGKGDTYTVKVGHTGMKFGKVASNIIGIAKEMDELFPGGFENVRSLGVKTDKSILVPVYLTLKNNRTVKVPIVKPKLPKRSTIVKGTLSTYLNASVIVTPGGDVTLKKKKLKKTKNVPVHIAAMDEDEVDDGGDQEEDETESVEDKPAVAVRPDEEQSDEEVDDLVKEEEMYLTHYEHEQDQEEENLKQKSKNRKRKQTA